MSIGEVVRNSGKAASAIRYYEEIGMPPEPLRVSGRRPYPREVVRTLAVIEAAQRAGLTLDDCPLFEPSRLPEREHTFH
jgi:DNA-binding transcriptional MerR regulator